MKRHSVLGLILAGLVGPALAAPQLDQSNLASASAGTAVGSDFGAQVVTVGIPGILASVDFSIRKFDGFTFGDLTLQIRGVTSGVPNATVLGSKTFPNASISPTPAEFTTFDLQSLGLAFAAGDRFAIVFTSFNHSGSPFPVAITVDTYPGGGLYSSADGTSWFPFAGRDARFRTFMADPVQVVGIDVKPGSDPNCFNINGHGVIPVAILGSDTFDVLDIDAATLSFGGLSVRVRGNKGPLCSVEDSNGDAHLDLVCHFEDEPDNWAPGDDEATLTGSLVGGGEFKGTDAICVVP